MEKKMKRKKKERRRRTKEFEERNKYIKIYK